MDEVSDEQIIKEIGSNPFQLERFIDGEDGSSSRYALKAMEYFVFLCREAEPLHRDQLFRYKEILSQNQERFASAIQKGNDRFCRFVRKNFELNTRKFEQRMTQQGKSASINTD